MANDVEEGVREFLTTLGRADLAVADLGDDYRLIDNEVLDSMGIFQLVEMIEDRFGVTIADEELAPEHFETVGAVVQLVRSKLPG